LAGAIHEEMRVVRDGNVFTSGGVTSGIDFAFQIVAELGGQEVAQAIQLGLEYDPSPPFDAGSPSKASRAATELMIQRNGVAHAGIQQGLKKIFEKN
jgi:cyclohexyl-isocyanide hydratase